MSSDLVTPFPLPVPVRAIPRWSAGGLFALWFLVTSVMAALSLGLAPWLIARNPAAQPGLIYWGCIIVGMGFQMLVSIAVLLAEGQSWRWTDLRRALWLGPPRDPETGRTAPGILWGVLPVGIVLVFGTDLAWGWLDDLIALLLPGWLNPPYADITGLATSRNTGNWTLLWIALLSSLFNYVLGEGFFFHGILLPRMVDRFGSWGWAMNALAFGSYHLHKAASWPTLIISCAAYSWPAQRTRSIWPALLIHGAEGVILIAAVLAVILGFSVLP